MIKEQERQVLEQLVATLMEQAIGQGAGAETSRKGTSACGAQSTEVAGTS